MKTRNLIIITPIFLLLSHYLAVFAHEYAHAVTAWLLGYKASPLDINYGGTSLLNILLLANIDQKVDSNAIFALGHPGHVALIAAMGPLMSLFLFIVSCWLLTKKRVTAKPLLFYFLFFFCFWNLGDVYAYVPIRTFTPHGTMVDILDVEQGLQISPWWFYIVVGYGVTYMIWFFFTKNLISGYHVLKLQHTYSKAILMVLCVLLLFGYCGSAGLYSHGEISHFLSATSLIAIPGLIVVLWPTRLWVKRSNSLLT